MSTNASDGVALDLDDLDITFVYSNGVVSWVDVGMTWLESFWRDK